MQTAGPSEDHRFALVDRHLFVAFLVEVAQLTPQRCMNVADAELEVIPEVGGRIFQVEHDTRRTRVQHFHHQLRIVRGSGHLVALILAPVRQRNVPVAGRRFRRA